MRYLAVDLDRTLIPNGPSPDDGSLALLSTLLYKHSITLIYVTARHFASIEQAIIRYNLPLPKAIIAQVGSKIYHQDSQGHFTEDHRWSHEIIAQNPHWDAQNYTDLTTIFTQLSPQESLDCNAFKVSYNLTTLTNFDTFSQKLHKTISLRSSTPLEIIISKDLNSNQGYLDILPQGVSKKGALDFLCSCYAIEPKDIIFAGDSENDLSLLLSSYQTVVVANAEHSLKEMIRHQKDTGEHYEARPTDQGNGNYASGIIQGLSYFRWI